MKYESVFVIKPDLLINEIDKLIKKIENIIVEQNSGNLNSIQKLGKRKLAYCIKNYNEGYYIQFKFDGNNKVVSLIEKFCKLNDLIIRFIILKDKKKQKLKSNINNKK
jgi:small subunit ribosomal protein S6